MSKVRAIVLICLFAASPVVAKPLITSSEETVARVCLARTETPPRIVEACDAALTDATLTSAQRVELLIARADGYLWQEMYDAAVRGYREATAADPQSVEAWNGLGWALWEAQGDEAAYEAFERSVSIDVSVQGLGGKAATARRLGYIDNATAREMLQASLSIDPDYIWAVREIAWSLLEDKDYSASATQFQAALDIEPRDANARYGLGRTKLSSGDHDGALELFNAVLLDSPDDFATQVYRIIALRNLDRNAQALRFADRMIEAYPERASGYIERGQALIALQRRAEAIETYAHAETAVGPNNAILYWYADALTIDGRFGEALSVIERGLSLDGVDYSDHLLRSYIALEMKNYSLARLAAEASLATGVDDPWAHYYIAITLIHDGEISEGLSRFERAMHIGLPGDRVGAFASELISAGKYVEAAQLRLKY
ncbi:MAG: tetratricopeptide repeat protein [Silicimonas sp.]|nr:tetratricopeptide repeat protein [Silicimonas sp.]